MSHCCDKPGVHQHGSQAYRDGKPHGWRHEFEWRFPKLSTYRAADRHPVRFGLNRYPGVVIGAWAQFGQRAVSLVWGKPGRIVESEVAR